MYSGLLHAANGLTRWLKSPVVTINLFKFIGSNNYSTTTARYVKQLKSNCFVGKIVMLNYSFVKHYTCFHISEPPLYLVVLFQRKPILPPLVFSTLRYMSRKSEFLSSSVVCFQCKIVSNRILVKECNVYQLFYCVFQSSSVTQIHEFQSLSVIRKKCIPVKKLCQV